jgi:D-serine deaminase-like pyridoxal phosphate-dependent protein
LEKSLPEDEKLQAERGSKMNYRELETPTVVLDLNILEANIEAMANFAKAHDLNLRPHIKAHKIPQIAKLQLAHGACGITASKLTEAETMALPNLEILLAYQVVDPRKAERLVALLEKTGGAALADGKRGIEILARAAAGKKWQLPLLVEVDTGLGRCGVEREEDLLALVEEIEKEPWLKFQGLLTHAGHVYAAVTSAQVEEIGRFEGERLVELARFLEEAGHRVETVSVGSTPTARIAGQVPGVTEIRPGNYVFNDAIQVALGAAKEENCALSVLATVISTPAKGRAVIDAGSKVLALDRGAHGTSLVRGFGIVRGYKEIIVERLSEEHGILSFPTQLELRVGQVLEIIPNHACPVVNLASKVVTCRGGEVQGNWQVAARGMVR